MKGIKPLNKSIKGLDDLIEAIETQVDLDVVKADYCLYYRDNGTIYEASTQVDELRSHIKIPSKWLDTNHITDWVIINGKLEPVKHDTYDRLRKYTKVTHATELDPDLPVYVTDKDHRIIKEVITADKVRFNKDENYYQLQQEKR